MGYSTQRGYGNTHPFAAEIRYGALEAEMHIEERASGFVQHLKLPHYVDFQANLELLRRMRGERLAAAAAPT